jgi:multiple sugar transport system permease protein
MTPLTPATSATSASSGASLRRRPRGGWRQSAVGWTFMAPFAVVFLLFTAIPIVASLVTSLTDMHSNDLRTPFAVDFVGLQNYAAILGEPRFLRAVLNTMIFVVIGVPLTMLAGFGLALALDSGIRRFRALFRGLFYAPVVANIVSVALIWQYAFNQDGTVNEVLAGIGLAGPNWLGDTDLAMPVVILLGIWRNFGTAMLLFLAGLQAIPEDVIEAATLDGAGPLRRLRSITLPLLMPTTLLVSVLLTVFFLQVFDEPYLLTGGGPLGSTESIALYTYNQFGFGNFGVSSAASYLLLIIVATFSAVQFRLLRSRS